MSTLDQIDAVIREHMRTEAPNDGPVVAWVLIAATDNHGSEDEDVIWIESPDGQRGFVTTGLVAEASAISAQRRAGGEE